MESMLPRGKENPGHAGHRSAAMGRVGKESFQSGGIGYNFFSFSKMLNLTVASSFNTNSGSQ